MTKKFAKSRKFVPAKLSTNKVLPAACSKMCAINTLDPCSCGTVDDVIRWCVEVIPSRVHNNLNVGEGMESSLIELHVTAKMSEHVGRNPLKLCRAHFVPRLYEQIKKDDIFRVFFSQNFFLVRPSKD